MYKYYEINEHGNNIRCKIYYKEKMTAEKAIIYCTGFAGHKDNNAAKEFAEKVLSKYKDVIVLVFNWPAHGDDIALRCPAVDMYDVLTRAIMKNDEYDRIMKGKDVQVGFDRKIIVTRKLLDELKTNDIRQRDYLEEAENILIIHGTADEVVPFDSSRAFAENNVIDFIPVEKADHRFQNPAHRSAANKYTLEFFDMQ